MQETQKFTINPDFSVERFDNEILLYAVTGSTGVYLNETAFLVWEMCGKNHSVGQIITLLEEAYPEQKKTIREDVITALESLSGDVDSPLIAVNG